MANPTITVDVRNVKVVKDELRQLREELAITDQLLSARNEVLALIPECPIHGPQCLPYMEHWIRIAKIAMAKSEARL